MENISEKVRWVLPVVETRDLVLNTVVRSFVESNRLLELALKTGELQQTYTENEVDDELHFALTDILSGEYEAVVRADAYEFSTDFATALDRVAAWHVQVIKRVLRQLTAALQRAGFYSSFADVYSVAAVHWLDSARVLVIDFHRKN